MNDPLDRATSSAPPTLGEGCVRRYDPAALDDEAGSDFADAAALWQSLQAAPGGADKSAGQATTAETPSPADRGVD